MTRPNIELHIQELVLEGIDPTDRGAMVAAFEQELYQQLANAGALDLIVEAGSRDRIRGELPPANTAVNLGHNAARALASSLAVPSTARGSAQ